MRRRWLLSLLCLSVFFFLSLVQLTRARGEFKVSESNTRILFDKRAAIVLAVENSTGETLITNIELEILDPRNTVTGKVGQNQSIEAGNQKLNFALPLNFSNLDDHKRKEILWYRLRYRIKEGSSAGNTLAAGIISFSEITPDVFDLRVATSEVVREKDRLLARVQASHPLTRRPAASVQIDGEITFNFDNDKKTTLRSFKTTDSNGQTVLEFIIPPLFPQLRYNVRPEDAELHVTGKKAGLVAEVTGEVQVDQFARTLLSTDKPLYQPGQVMHIRALFFTPAKRALANQDASIRICDADRNVVYRAIAKTSRFGIATTDWSIPENTRLGECRIWVGVDGGDEEYEAGLEVRISRYDLPNFTVNVDTDRAYYLPGQNAEVKVRADYLFGKPVARGHVRVVRENEREWNYSEQKWDIDEGETYEGETDASGAFVAQINLTDDHADLTDDYEHFKDSTYAAYFTDPTTNRTEQRRFDLRVTREAIHVYLMYNGEWVQNNSLPLKFYVSTSYADGTPAQVKVNVSVSDESTNIVRPALATVRTNRYGLAKISGVRLPLEFADESDMKLVISAGDSKGRKGSRTETVTFDDDNEEAVRVETNKALYRSGEPITAYVTSSVPEQNVVVDLFRESTLIRSELVKLHDGRGSVVFAYSPEFKDELTLTAYGNATKWRNSIGSHTILYPRDPELKVDVRTSQATYRPGEHAQVNLSIRAPEGRNAESALGVVVLDKAVEERFRTDQEFGSRITTLDDSFKHFLGADQYVAGMSIRDLQRLDMSKYISADTELIAELLLTQSGRSVRTFHGDDQYNRDHAALFGNPIKQQLAPVREALESRYGRTSEYPTDEQSLRRLLSESKIDFNSLRDPWDVPYRTWFSVYQHSDDVMFESAGADKRFDTADDFTVYRLGWPYFRPTGEAINRAVSRYHDRTGRFVRDSSALRDALSADGLNMDQLRDRWGKPYRFEFDVNGTNYLISVRSSGSDKQFADDKTYSADDFVIWTSTLDYFEQTRAQIGEALRQNSESTTNFPETERDLRSVLRNSPNALETLRDPWNRSYYTTIKTESFPMDRLQVEDRSSFGTTATPQISVTPVMQTARFISLRSAGVDGKTDTNDDFSVAVFTGLLSERRKSETRPATPEVIFQGNSGAIQGVVTDPQGAVVQGTMVTATLSVERLTYQTSTNDNGNYRLVNLPPGMYEIRFEARGFTNHVVTHVLVRASYVTDLDVSMRPGTVTEVVTVTGDAANLVELSAGVSTNVTTRNLVVKPEATQQLSTPRLREYFPETLLWQPSIETDKQGRAQINFKLADNITTWKMVVIGSTEDGQIGMTEKEIKAFQPFFIDHDPPRVLTEGDEISLPVTVRNYLEREQKVDLEIKPENWFSLSGLTRKQISVAPSDAMRETFDLRVISPIKNGKQRITATGNDDSDAIEKPVTVHPDGEERSVTDSDIIADRSALELDIPETMIPNSKRAELKVYPNLMTHVVESVEGIMQRPHGCGEQTISSTYPSLLLSRFYKQSGGSSPLRGRAERYLNEGYERLLRYRHENGGFTYWGYGEANLALTAYALRFLTDASEVISVNPAVIKGAREWLFTQQQPDGSWGSPQDTAYVARVITQASSERPDALKQAVAYLDKNVLASNEPYSLASYVLTAIKIGDASRAKPAVDKLRLLSHAKGAALYWTAEKDTPFHGWGRAGQVETTALVVQALFKYCESQTADCEVNKRMISLGLLFLLKEKDQYGVWYSTQATINSLDALLLAVAKLPKVQADPGETHVVINGRVAQTFQIPVEDRLNNPITVDITEFVNAGKNRIEFKRAAGFPLASIQAVASFYVPWSESSARSNGKNGLSLYVKFDKTEGRINDEITCYVEAERGSSGWGMLLAEIGLPPGAEVDRSSLQAALKSSDGTINSYDVLPDRVVVYLWPRNGGVTFNFKFRPRLGMNAKTAPSSVYDYYNPDSRAVVAPATFKVR